MSALNIVCVSLGNNIAVNMRWPRGKNLPTFGVNCLLTLNPGRELET